MRACNLAEVKGNYLDVDRWLILGTVLLRRCFSKLKSGVNGNPLHRSVTQLTVIPKFHDTVNSEIRSVTINNGIVTLDI